MPLSATKRQILPDTLDSTSIEIDSDSLSPLGIKRGSTIEYFVFEERFKDRWFHIAIKKTGKEALTRICFDCQPVKIQDGDAEYGLEDIEILGLIVVKPKLRILK